MEMFLVLVLASVLVGGVSALLMVAAERAHAPAERREEPRPVLVPSHFFVADRARPPAYQPAIPIELLVSQIDGHVRLEQAAMEAFLQSPNAQSLHSRTTSTLVN
jgi:hypothetical protein